MAKRSRNSSETTIENRLKQGRVMGQRSAFLMRRIGISPLLGKCESWLKKLRLQK